MTIIIQGTSITFPETGNSPIWSEAVIQFAAAVELALSGLTSVGDLGKEYFPLTAAHNPVSNLTVTGFNFDSSTIRSVFASYSIYRNTTTGSPTTVAETGTMKLVYNPTNAVGNKWEISIDRVGNAQATLSITDAGQVQITTTTIPGTGHTGQVGFLATVLNQ